LLRRRRSPAWPGVLLGVLLGLAVAAVTGLFVVAPLALVHRDAGELERSYSSLMVGWVASLNAPEQLPRPSAQGLDAGRRAYAETCAQCHGATGDGKGMFGQTSFPPATDLTGRDARERSDAELFWIIKNGLGFTAMPGYERQYEDAEIPALVSYLRELQRVVR